MSALNGAGCSVTYSTGAFDLATLSAFDGVLLGGTQFGYDAATLTAYVNSGHSAYIAGGTAASADEDTVWDSFTHAFGLDFGPSYNGIIGTLSDRRQRPAARRRLATLLQQRQHGEPVRFGPERADHRHAQPRQWRPGGPDRRLRRRRPAPSGISGRPACPSPPRSRSSASALPASASRAVDRHVVATRSTSPGRVSRCRLNQDGSPPGHRGGELPLDRASDSTASAAARCSA